MDRQPVARHESVLARIRHAVMATLRQILVLGLLAGIIAGLVTEGVGAAILGGFPDAATHVAAVAIALLMAYAVGVSLALRATIRAVAGSMEWVGGRVDEVVDRLVHETETLVERQGPTVASASHAQHAATVVSALPAGSHAGMHDGVLAGIADAADGYQRPTA